MNGCSADDDQLEARLRRVEGQVRGIAQMAEATATASTS
jgi:DNA-binding FrmR family transcriptional regulator